jgi:hypothetical protein
VGTDTWYVLDAARAAYPSSVIRLPKLHRKERARAGFVFAVALSGSRSRSRSPLPHLCFRNHNLLIFAHTIKNHPPPIDTGSVSPDTCQYPHNARPREQATRARHREHQEAQGARAARKTRRKTRTRQALGSSSWPRRLTHRLSLLSQTETSELKRRALFLAGI